MQGNIRLLETLTEELLWLWEQVKEIKRDTILITKEERRKLDKIIAKTITEQASSFLNESNQDKLELITKKAVQIIQENINMDSLKARLESFFQKYPLPRNKTSLSNRIKIFVDTRNSIAHTGQFANTNPSYKAQGKKLTHLTDHDSDWVTDEINNAKMMIPIMLFAIFGYDGDYTDLIELYRGRWR
jgi:hypothetical protein